MWRIRRLPAREPIGATAAACLPGLDSRACAALLKELARTGLAHRAQEFFDHVLALGDSSEAARLADVYTYTAAISICVSAQQVLPPCRLLAPLTTSLSLLSPFQPLVWNHVVLVDKLQRNCSRCSMQQYALLFSRRRRR